MPESLQSCLIFSLNFFENQVAQKLNTIAVWFSTPIKCEVGNLLEAQSLLIGEFVFFSFYTDLFCFTAFTSFLFNFFNIFVDKTLSLSGYNETCSLMNDKFFLFTIFFFCNFACVSRIYLD